MLRLIFVFSILIMGSALALRNPLSALLLYLWWAYFRPDYWVHTSLLRALPISFGIGVFLLGKSILSGAPFRFDLRVALLFAILILATVSTILSDYFAFSALYVFDFCRALIVTYLVATLAEDTKRLRQIVLVMALSLAFEGAKQGWAQLVLNPGGTNMNPVAFLGDNNGVAVGMLMLVPMLVALARTATRKPERWLHWFLAVGVLYRAVSTYSRGGFLAAAALGFMYLVRSPRKVPALIGAALAASLTLSVMPDAFWDRMDTIKAPIEGEERERSSEGRLHFWEVAAVMAADRPLVGIGINAFTQAYDRYDFKEGAFGRKRSVHSAWFGMLAELGITGFVLFASVILLALLACQRARRLARRGLVSPELGVFASAFDSAIVVFAVGGSFVIFQYTEMLWHVIGLTMAVHFLTSREFAAASARRAPPVESLAWQERIVS